MALQKAFETLRKSTHLYGRRLVLEWAAQEETIDDLRAKTARLASASKFDGDNVNKGSTKKRLALYFQSKGAATRDKEDEDSDNE